MIHGCTKQKINTKSSTESEVVGVSDFLPYAVWASHFLQVQGYKLKQNFFYQDNTSAIRMIKNGKSLAGNRSRHIHIRYFFTKDILNRENIEVEHCTTNKMIAGFYTKSLQGMQFYNLRKIIMGHCNVSVEERVEDKNNPATDHVTTKHVSTKRSKKGTVQGIRVSSNFD